MPWTNDSDHLAAVLHAVRDDGWRDEMARSVFRGDVHVVIGRRRGSSQNPWGLVVLVGVYALREDAIAAMHSWTDATVLTGEDPLCVQSYVHTEMVR